MSAVTTMTAAETETIRRRLAGSKIKVTDCVALRSDHKRMGIVFAVLAAGHDTYCSIVFPDGGYLNRWASDLIRVAPSFLN